MDINRVFISGTLTREPELSYTLSNKAICRMNIIVRDQNKINFFNVVVFGKLAEFCGNKLQKDSKIVIEGKLKFSTYTIKSGEKRRSVEIIAEKVHYIEKGGKIDG
jgi:single-strand DNA-binding protein